MPHIKANGITLHYRIDGPEDGQPLLLSNSLASNLHMWDPQIADLTSAGFRVIRYDSRGHGQSDAPEGAYSIEMLAEDAVALLDGLGIEKADYCGLSKGGMVGQMLGVRHRDRVSKLILADTSAHMPTQEMWDGRVRTVEKGGMAAVADATIERWFTPASQQRLKDDIGKVPRHPAAGLHRLLPGDPGDGSARDDCQHRYADPCDRRRGGSCNHAGACPRDTRPDQRGGLC